MEDEVTLEELLAEERAVWEALKRGDAAVDEAALSEDFLGVYATGFGDRAGHVAQLAAGPTVAQYRIEAPCLIRLGPGLGLLAYRVEYIRVGRAEPEAMYVSSIWRRERAGWRNIFSQDTEEGDEAPV